MKHPTKSDALGLICSAGLLLITYGLWMIWPPLSLIFAGAYLIAVAYSQKDKEPKP